VMVLWPCVSNAALICHLACPTYASRCAQRALVKADKRCG
jgi:hypothetical protein